jgi:hypothetical protein
MATAPLLAARTPRACGDPMIGKTLSHSAIESRIPPHPEEWIKAILGWLDERLGPVQ